jgi:hypothetical protein
MQDFDSLSSCWVCWRRFHSSWVAAWPLAACSRFSCWGWGRAGSDADLPFCTTTCWRGLAPELSTASYWDWKWRAGGFRLIRSPFWIDSLCYWFLQHLATSEEWWNCCWICLTCLQLSCMFGCCDVPSSNLSSEFPSNWCCEPPALSTLRQQLCLDSDCRWEAVSDLIRQE